tara:strand:- start:75 stop:386 length:312 start_codon:yes stop_codon:yes gene_type:complete
MNEEYYTNQEYFRDCLRHFAIPKGWQNVSYLNDEAPSFIFNDYQIFVEHHDPIQRFTDSKRFIVYDTKDETFIMESDFIEDVESIINFSRKDKAIIKFKKESQ